MDYFPSGPVSQVHAVSQAAIGIRLLLEGELQQVQRKLMVLGVEVPELRVARRVIEVVSVVAVDQSGDFRAAEEGEYSLIFLLSLFVLFSVVFLGIVAGFGDFGRRRSGASSRPGGSCALDRGWLGGR